MNGRFWVGWIQPTKDYRPLNFPPNERVWGYWCSGYDSNENAMLCAVVEAESEADIAAIIKTDWPECTAFRFCERREVDWIPGNRFPLSDWMEIRFEGGNPDDN